MHLVNEFTVDAPIETAWSALTDIPRMAACIPGAQIDGSDGAGYDGRAVIKVGPVGLTLLGTATVLSRDDDEHSMVLRGSARDRKGQGSAEVVITMNARADGNGSAVTVTTDLELGGRIAQFGAGVISQVSGRIIGQFVTRLNAMIAAESGAPATAISAAPATPGRAFAAPGTSDRRDRFISLAVTTLAGAALGLAVGRAVYARP
ncbi:SRPBCC family protein [Nocardia sp. BMG51109]|uniref:SRPBCC family protein n=1 Tax=Nocardia sp. BMG51109 TaxID=1056816 RepID=UPI000466FB99|nr:SRPBCC family protein [Nocardia sp. BMG51109]